MDIYCTSFCNFGHRLLDGKPAGHECYILPVKALQAEREGDVAAAIEHIESAKPLQTHRGVRT